MPDIDRDALNRALADKVGAVLGMDSAYHDAWVCRTGHEYALWMYQCACGEPGGLERHIPTDYCGSLDASVSALIALGLQWQKTGVKTVAVWRYGEHAEIQPADDATPAALATALVLGALQVLGEEETDA